MKRWAGKKRPTEREGTMLIRYGMILWRRLREARIRNRKKKEKKVVFEKVKSKEARVVALILLVAIGFAAFMATGKGEVAAGASGCKYNPDTGVVSCSGTVAPTPAGTPLPPPNGPCLPNGQVGKPCPQGKVSGAKFYETPVVVGWQVDDFEGGGGAGYYSGDAIDSGFGLAGGTGGQGTGCCSGNPGGDYP